MSHDVFISHSARDKPHADAVCAKLESQGIRCWIAPRDIEPGMDWGAAILEAIDGAHVMLLVFSSHANGSPQIKREIERAVNKEIIVIPVRVEDVKPTGNLEYFLGTPHWLDAITPPFERHLERIADSAKFWLKRIDSDAATSENPRPTQLACEEPSLAKRSSPNWIVLSILIALLGTAAFFGARYFPTAGRTFRDCSYCPEMVVVPAGRFTMGSPLSEPGRDKDESPQHRVTIGYAFAVSKYPVTRDEYARFASETSSNSEWQNPGFGQTGSDPVTMVNWDDAKAYVAWLTQKTGKTYRLLSESEYEFAERAGTSTAYWWGDDTDHLCSYADGPSCGRQTAPVGSYPANAFGLQDMTGNVWEWTEDCFNADYVDAPDDGRAQTAGTCGLHVLRGGSWQASDAKDLRSAYRGGYFTINRANDFGFRVARTL